MPVLIAWRAAPSSHHTNTPFGLRYNTSARLGTTQLRTEFSLPEGAEVTLARVHVATPGYCSLHVNGADVDPGAVMGAFTVFTRKTLYNVYDVTTLLAAPPPASTLNPSHRNHTVALTLANGWYSQPTVDLGPRVVMVYLVIVRLLFYF